MRINKYLAHEKYCTRREADELIESGRVLINGRRALLGEKVRETDVVEVRFRPKSYRYVAYYKPRGIVTHSPQGDEQEIAGISGLRGLFPVGRLDKDSEGLIVLTDDGRLTDALLNPKYEHEKEYEVTVGSALQRNFKSRMERGVYIGEYTTKPAHVDVRGPRKFSVTLTEGKKHQIRRMCDRLGLTVAHLKRVRIMNVELKSLAPNAHRVLAGAELKDFLSALKLTG
jgi:23S rRNA pseudouridine2604 synthase